ncbi:MAG TPA: T9SS type A sorting domain-containing protein, partial [Paludibacteraceae bacterium]|nr:T9SS type A sorting domain-containing protein [Paludibacteraceae bacterium]
MGISVTADGSGAEVAFAQEQWHGGIVPSKSADETEKLNLLCARVWDKPYDASKIFAAEINHAAKVVSKNVVLGDIAVPEGYDCDKIQVRMLVKYCALGTATDDAAWALEDADRSYNISAFFDNDSTLTQLNSDSLKGAWNWVTAKVDVPNGAKSISINFGKKVTFAYYVDQIYLEKPAECLVGVDEVNSDLTAVAVYPNPVTDVVYAAENASKMEVISLTGAVMASANGSSVNVSGLAAGTYIVKVYTTNGVATQTIIKK